MGFAWALIPKLLIATSVVLSAHAECLVDECQYVDIFGVVQKDGQRMCKKIEEKQNHVENVCTSPRMKQQILDKGGVCGCCDFNDPINQVTKLLNTAACPLPCVGDDTCSVGKNTLGHLMCRSLKKPEIGYVGNKTQCIEDDLTALFQLKGDKCGCCGTFEGGK